MTETTLLPYHFSKAQGMVAMPGPESDASLNLYHLPNPSLEMLVEAKRILRKPFTLIEVDEQTFQQRLTQAYQAQSSSILEAKEGMSEIIDLSDLAKDIPSSEDLLESQDEAPIIRLINALFSQAIQQKASDIHIETYEDRVLVRYRVDGVLHEVLEIQRQIAPLVISRVKVMAKLDIAEKRVPQDGRITLRIGGNMIDVRVSTLPSNHGERIVLRILDKQTAQLDLSLLGIPDDTLTLIRKIIAEPHGIFLVTGPTGSGKTTSLYAMLSELNQVSRNILTIEDPIEYDIPGIGQTQVNPKVQMTFAKGLRAILRQDPDVVMVGEIRDLETAEIAIQASLTGHLVLSTLHTNTALGAITRLHDMGVESFLLSTSLIGLMAQRLVRKLCIFCKKARPLREEEIELMEIKATSEEILIYEPHGCPECNQQGYSGRTGVYELIPMDETLQGMIHRSESITDMTNYVRKFSLSIRQDGFRRVLLGETSLSELLRVS